MQKFDQNTNRLIIKKYLPHNFLAEKTILSSLLINPEAINIVVNKIVVEAFYFKNHQEIYKALISMFEKKIPIDLISLTTFLQDKGLLEKIGGLTVLTELINQIPDLVHLEEHIRLVEDKSLRRSLIQLGYKAINSGYVTNIPLEKILTDLEEEILNLTNIRQRQNLLSTTDLLSNVISDLKQRSLELTLPGLPSGFYDLDAITQGFQKSDLIIVAGRPSMGKTAFCLEIALNIIKNYELPVLVFSLEMSKEQVIYRLLASETKISNLKLKSANISKHNWTLLSETIQILSSLPLFIDDTPGLIVEQIRTKVRNILFEQAKIGLIIIDYLQLKETSLF